jgi:hypothetical protein
MLGHSVITGFLLSGWITLRMIAILSSLYCLTNPTFVLAAKAFTVPNDFEETLLL